VSFQRRMTKEEAGNRKGLEKLKKNEMATHFKSEWGQTWVFTCLGAGRKICPLEGIGRFCAATTETQLFEKVGTKVFRGGRNERLVARCVGA